MSSSDEDWLKPPTLRKPGRGGAEDPMMAARRQALQRQREAAHPVVSPTATSKTSPSVSMRTDKTGSQQQTTAISGGGGVTEEMLESLRVELETKKITLASLRERETELRDHWRAQKAQRLAEIAHLEDKMRRQKNAMDDIKAEAERQAREAEEMHRKQMEEEREKIEKEIEEEFQPQIDEQKAELEELQKQEAALRAELDASDSTEDLVNNCIGSALATILDRVQTMFAENASTTEEWEREVEDLVQREVRTSFDITCNSEAEREREEYERYFQDFLEFWRKTEEEQQNYVLKIDEQLLLDLEALVQEDLDRIQREELSIEEMFTQAREAWALNYQEVLKKDLDTALSRLSEELEEQRAMRGQIHLERMKAIEEQHQEMMEQQRCIHEKEMDLLREQFAKEEEIEEERSRVHASAQQDVAHAMEEFQCVMESMEGLLTQLKNYRSAIDEGHAALNADRQSVAEERESTLAVLQEMVTKQTVSVNEELNSISTTLGKLEVVSKTLERQMEEDQVWFSKQEAKFNQGKVEWEREHRRWLQMAEDEKHRAEERFGDVLRELHEATALLAEEERESKAEHASIESAIRTIGEQAAAEEAQLAQREEELKERQDEMTRLISELDERGAQVAQEWQRLQKERQDFQAEEASLREDEAELRQMAQQLQFFKAQAEGMHLIATMAQNNANTGHQHQEKVEATKATDTRAHRHETGCAFFPDSGRSAPAALRQSHPRDAVPRVSKNANRLPLRVLGELRDMLSKSQREAPRTSHTLTRAAFASTLDSNAAAVVTQTKAESARLYGEASRSERRLPTHADPHRQTRCATLSPVRGEGSRDTSAAFHDSSSTNNFTRLLALSDAESANESLQP